MILKDARQEAFAQAVAGGSSNAAAARAAGYSTKSGSRPSKTAKGKMVSRRIEELKEEAEKVERSSTEALIVALLDQAKTAVGESNLPLVRDFLLAAARMRMRKPEIASPLLALAPPEPDPEDDQAFRPLTEAQWEAMRQPPR